MQSFLFHRFFSFISVCCVAFAVMATTCVQAAEFKPFFTLKIDSPESIIAIVEKASGLVDPSGALGIKAMLTPYKKLPGVKSNGTIGLALQRNATSAFGIDAVLFLPITNVDTFSIPGQGEMVNQVKTMLQKEGTEKYLMTTPVGDFIAYQKKEYIVISPVSAADIADTAEPKDLFADLNKFTLGFTVNLENLTMEDVEAMLGSLTGILAMQGMSEGFDMEAVLTALKNVHDEMSSWTEGIVIDERSLSITASRQIVPKKDSQTAEKFLKIKDVKTTFGGFLQDTSKTVFSWSYINYLTDSEIAELRTATQLLVGGFAEGLSGATNEEGEENEGESQTQSPRLAEIIFAWFQENVNNFAENKLVNTAFSLDSDGTLLAASATTQPDLILKIGGDLYQALPELLGEEQGNAFRQLIGSKIKLDYETVAGFSLSSVSNLFADIPAEIVIPQRMKDLPFSVYWAEKNNEAVAMAIGFDAARTERALKTALGRTTATVTPKHTAVVSMKPLGELISRLLLPLMAKLGVEQTDIEANRELFPLLASAESGAKVVVTTEFENDAKLEKWQIDGKCLTVFAKLFAKQQELTAKRMLLEQQKQQEQPQEQPTTPQTPPQPAQEGEMQNPFTK